MTKSEAKKLAETIQTVDLQWMFKNAYGNVINWQKRSKVNAGCTIGVTFNIYTAGKIDHKTSAFVKSRMLFEFGEYLPYQAKPRKVEKLLPPPTHQEPKELPEDFVDPF